MQSEVKIVLTGDQALVLFDLVSRLAERDDVGFEDQAEKRVLWDLEADLERQLEAVVSSEYRTRVEEARAEVRDVEE